MYTTGHLYYDRAGKKITSIEWRNLSEDREYRRIEFEELPDGTQVSTVWLGLEHGVNDDGKPLIFETMSFLPNGDSDKCRRYFTEEEARLGHEEVKLEILKEVSN